MKIDKNIYLKHLGIYDEFITRIISIKKFEIDTMDSSVFNKYPMENWDPNFSNFIEAVENLNNNKKSSNQYTNFIMNSMELTKDGISINDPYVQSLGAKANDILKLMENQKEQHYALVLMNLCSIFELFVSNVMKFELFYINKNASDISKKEISFSKIKDLGSVENVKNYLIDQYIMDSHYKKATYWINDCFKKCSSFNFKGNHIKYGERISRLVNSISNMFEIRNIFTHNGGIVNDKFLESIKNSGYKKGDKIHLNKDDLLDYLNDTLVLSSEIFLHNIDKNKLTMDNLDYKGRLNNLIVKNMLVKYPLICRMFFDKMMENDKKLIDNSNPNVFSDKEKNSFEIELVNLWLTFDFAHEKENFVNYKDEYDTIKAICPDSSIISLLDIFIDGSDIELAINKSIDYISSLEDKNHKLDAVGSPIFHSISNNDKFIEYVKLIRYN